MAITTWKYKHDSLITWMSYLDTYGAGVMTEGESKRKPLSDEKLRLMLEAKGYSIARRTVAKYREQLNIPVARLRKEL